jgi:predicted transcriptional regulator
MFHFFKDRNANNPEPVRDLALGQLEMSVMEIVWTRGECSVRSVVESLDRELAYTTVMTTLARLFTKGLLARRKTDRAFLYSPRLSRSDWERARAGHFVNSFLTGPQPSRDLLISCLLEAVGEHDTKLLDDLEKRVREKRKELRRGES